MRLLCFVAVVVGVAAAFVPSSIPSSSTRVSSAAAHQQHQRSNRLPRPRRRATAVAAAEGGEGKEGAAAAGSVGVIVCDHGSRRENANTMLFEVAERYRTFSGFDIVEVSWVGRQGAPLGWRQQRRL